MFVLTANRCALLAAVLSILSGLLASCEVSPSGSSPGADPTQLEVRFDLSSAAELSTDVLADGLARDLDGDGKLEWIQASGQSGLVRVAWSAGLEGPGSGGTVQVLQPGGTPLRLCVGDFDGDGRLGLAVLSRVQGPGDSRISVYEQVGPGGLTLRASVVLSGLAVRIASGALGGALQPDRVLVPLPLAGSVQVLRLSGGILLLESALSFGFLGGPLDIAVIPAEQLPLGVPWPALAISEPGFTGVPGRVRWYRPSAELSYEPAGELASGLGLPLLAEPSDTDGDGRADLLICDVLGGERGLLRSAGGPLGLAAAVWIPGPNSPSDARCIALSPGALPDLFAAEPFRLSLTRLPRLPAGGFGAPETYLAPAQCLRLDLPNVGSVTGLHPVGWLQAEWVLSSSGAPYELRAARGYSAGQRPVLLEVGLLDGDAFTDVLILDQGANALLVMRGLPGLGFEQVDAVPLSSPPGTSPGGFRLGDLDADGDLDVLLAGNAVGRLESIENRGGLDFELGPSIDLSEAPIDLALLDLDLDGLLDVAVSLPAVNRLALLRGRGKLGFEPWAEIPLPKRPLALHAADLNGDPRPELIVSSAKPNGTDPTLLVFRAVEGSIYPLELAFVEALPGLGVQISTGDLNEDGRLDLLVTQSGPEIVNLPVFLSTPDPTAFDLLSVAIGSNPGAARLVDLDRDGHLDLAAALAKGKLAWLLGDGSGGLRSDTGPKYTLPSSTSALRFADLDHDQLPELLCVSPAAPELWVARNRSQ
jgi:hypothetical protein